MPRYMIQAQITPQTIATMISNPQNRAEVLRKLVEDHGGKMIEYYLEMAGSGLFSIIEMPDNESAATMMSATYAGGAMSSLKTTLIMTAEEAVGIFKNAGDVSYQPPSA